MSMNDRSYPRVISAVLAVFFFVLLLYIPALFNDFVNWDDYGYVRDNVNIRSFDLKFLRWALLEYYASNWHPLTWVSHAIDFKLWGLAPAGHHLTNVILHALNSCLVVILGLRLLSRIRVSATNSPHTDRSILLTAAIAGLLFGIHPVHVESVAWVSERKDLLCAFFYLAGILSYLAHEANRSHKTYLLTLLLFILALMSKPMAISFPFILLVLDWYPFGRFSNNSLLKRALLEKAPFVMLCVVSAALTIMAQRKGMGDVFLFPMSDRLLIALKALMAYLCIMAISIKLSPFNPYPIFGTVSLSSPEYLVPAVSVVAITIICALVMRKRPGWLAAWGYYLITILPVIGIVQVGMHEMADRYMYLPSVTLLLYFAAGLSLLYENAISSGRFRQPAVTIVSAVVLTGLILPLSAATFKQICLWKNSATLWGRVIELDDKKAFLAYRSRGSYYLETGRAQEAFNDYNQALLYDVSKPNKSLIYRSRALANARMGHSPEALSDFDEAIILDPDSWRAYDGRGKLLVQIGRFDDAVRDFTQAIRLQSDNAELYISRGFVYLKLARYEDAFRDYTSAIGIDPGGYNAYNDRAIVSSKMGRYEDALRDYTQASALNPGSSDIYFNMGNLYSIIGKYEESLSAYSKAIHLTPGVNSDYFKNRGAVYRKLGREVEAQQDFMRAAGS